MLEFGINIEVFIIKLASTNRIFFVANLICFFVVELKALLCFIVMCRTKVHYEACCASCVISGCWFVALVR
jgi:hypothetical protein